MTPSRPRSAVKELLTGIALAASLSGCTLHRSAGTGDVAFRLAWNGRSDLDLFVQDPSGGCVFFFNRTSPAGGVLDVDCNATIESLCAEPVENVYWPVGSAPDGEYLFWAEVHSIIASEAPVTFQLQVLRGADIVWVESAAARDHLQVTGPFRLELRNGRVLGRVTRVTRSPPNCFGR